MLPNIAVMIMGPTAVGKTDLAVSLVQSLPCEIISVDSAMIYKTMDIGSGKPDKDTLSIAPHRLIDILDPKESYSAALFCEDASFHLEKIFAKGKIPILVGGTMFYFRSLDQGLSDLPKSNTKIRNVLIKDREKYGTNFLHSRLSSVDPESANRINPNDSQRIIRALEVYEITGKTLTECLFRTNKTLKTTSDVRFLKIGLAPQDRTRLHEIIEIRFEEMLANGLIDEVESLYNRGDLDLSHSSMRCVGYRQVWEYLEGKHDYATMKEKAIAGTRQLAKRQTTWLRNEENMLLYDPWSFDPKKVEDLINDRTTFL